MQDLHCVGQFEMCQYQVSKKSQTVNKVGLTPELHCDTASPRTLGSNCWLSPQIAPSAGCVIVVCKVNVELLSNQQQQSTRGTLVGGFAAQNGIWLHQGSTPSQHSVRCSTGAFPPSQSLSLIVLILRSPKALSAAVACYCRRR